MSWCYVTAKLITTVFPSLGDNNGLREEVRTNLHHRSTIGISSHPARRKRATTETTAARLASIKADMANVRADTRTDTARTDAGTRIRKLRDNRTPPVPTGDYL